METKPEARQEKDPVNTLHNAFWAQDEVGTTISQNTSLQDKKAPRAEPEDDIDVLEPANPNETLQENHTFTRNTLDDGTKLGNEEPTRICLCVPREVQDIESELEQAPKKLFEALVPQDESEKSVAQSWNVFPPPPPLSDLSAEDCFENEGISSLEGEGNSDAQIISDPTEDITSPDSHNSQEWPQTPLLTEPIDLMLDSPSEETKEDIVTVKENPTQLHFLPDAFSTSEPESNTSGAAHQLCSDSNSTDNVCSPPFADESEGEEELNMDITSCQQQWASLDISQPSHSANISVSTEQDTTAADPAISKIKQQEELLIQSQCELAPRGENQEAAQQVYGQRSPPLSAVSIEVSNQGGTASQGCGCVVAVRERDSRAGESTEGETKQIDEEEGQNESIHERNKATGQQHNEGLLSYSTTVQIQDLKAESYTRGAPFKHSRHNRMESDSCDDSQSDSGVSADFSPGSTLEGNTTISTGTTPLVPKETPIEREIRRAIEREHSLRRSRGLPNPPTCPEYVDIPLRKTALCHSFAANSERYDGKDRQFAGKKMQHEILMEAQREQDLVKLGKVPGFYDKGTVRQLKDRKLIFEAFQKPSDSTVSVSTRSKFTSWSSASDISTMENQGDISSEASTIGPSYGELKQSIELLGPTENHSLVKGGAPTNAAPRRPGFSETTTCQVIILENTLSVPALKLYNNKQNALLLTQEVTAVDSGSPYISSSRTGGHSGIRGREVEKEEEIKEEGMFKKNPFFKLRSSTSLDKVEQDIREAQEREKELHKQRISLYGSTGGTARGVRILPPSSLNGLAAPDSPRSSSRPTGTEAARQSVGKLGMWPPAQPQDDKITQPEALQSPQNPRQRPL